MSTLQDNLNAIKLDKNTNLLPENLKAGVTCLGITGTYEGSGGGTVEGIKQFSTVEEMQNSTGNNEGDLAVVYRSEVKNATVDSKFQVATFPDTVVLDTAITDPVEVRYRAVDSSKSFDCMGSLDSSNFMMDCYTETGNIRIQYTSSDGITYTRTDTTGNPVDFGTEIYYEMAEMWNDAIGKFIQIGGSTFEGLYECRNTVAYYTYPVYNPDMANIVQNVSIPEEILNLNPVFILPTKIENNQLVSGSIYLTEGDFYRFSDIGWVPSVSTHANTNPIVKKYELTDGVLGELETLTANIQICGNGQNTDKQYSVQPDGFKPFTTVILGFDKGIWGYNYNEPSTGCPYLPGLEYGSDGVKPSFYDRNIKKTPVYELHYHLASTQLTASPDYVYEKEFYGKNGLEIGKLQNKENLTKDEVKRRVDIWTNYSSGIVCPSSLSSMFRNCTNLITIPELNTSKVTDMTHMFYGCTNLTTIPLLDTSSVTSMYFMFADCTNLTTIPELNTSKVTNMGYMFRNCTNLTTIPELNASKVTDMAYMFYGCTNLTTIPLLDISSVTYMSFMFANCTSLSEESLNNILAMCINATSYTTNTKTLKQLGLTSEQATKCTTLSNYSAFTSAGWTTGY